MMGLSMRSGTGIDVIRIDSPATTSIHNVYHTADCEKRDVTLLSQASSFTPDIEQHLSGEIIHLAGLFRGEIPDELIPVCQRSGKVALDAQGVLRCNDGTSLSFNDWKEKRTYLPMVTYLKTDAAEAFILTGTEDRVEAARMLIAWGAGEVMVTHNREVIVASHDQVCRAPYTPKNLSGRTGRGDTTFAAYLAWRIDHPIDESVRFAAALCSLKMEAAGPFSGSLDDVFQRMRQDRS